MVYVVRTFKVWVVLVEEPCSEVSTSITHMEKSAWRIKLKEERGGHTYDDR